MSTGPTTVRNGGDDLDRSGCTARSPRQADEDWSYHLFAELGKNAGDTLYDIMQMDSHDWNLVGRYTLDQLSDFIKSAGNGSGRVGGAPGTNRRVP